MSSPNHPTFDIEDAFTSNFLDYIPASPDYVPASPGNTYSSSSNNLFGLVPKASPTLSLFHDDPYMKVMKAYYAKESPIPPPTIKGEKALIGQVLDRHEEQIEEILNHLDELSLDRIEHIEDKVEECLPKTSHSEGTAMTQVPSGKLVDDSETAALGSTSDNMAKD
ncbi:hypothetical protein Tco_0722196 [Tanacetum coccineum]